MSSVEGQGGDLCDEHKLFKLLEHERKKKTKFSHAGLLVEPASAEYHHRGAFYAQRTGSLKRKRKDAFPNDLKQRIQRRKEAESSSE
jgi:hypothetical protein